VEGRLGDVCDGHCVTRNVPQQRHNFSSDWNEQVRELENGRCNEKTVKDPTAYFLLPSVLSFDEIPECAHVLPSVSRGSLQPHRLDFNPQNGSLKGLQN
jgi:hypothetical protein